MPSDQHSPLPPRDLGEPVCAASPPRRIDLSPPKVPFEVFAEVDRVDRQHDRSVPRQPDHDRHMPWYVVRGLDQRDSGGQLPITVDQLIGKVRPISEVGRAGGRVRPGVAVALPLDDDPRIAEVGMIPGVVEAEMRADQDIHVV